MKLNLGFYLAVLPQFGYWRGFLMMKSIGQPVPESVAVSSTEEALEFSRSQKFPLIVRPDFTLGGTGGGIAWNEEELKERIKEGLQASPVHRVLVENYLFCPSIEVDL